MMNGGPQFHQVATDRVRRLNYHRRVGDFPHIARVMKVIEKGFGIHAVYLIPRTCSRLLLPSAAQRAVKLHIIEHLAHEGLRQG